MIYVWTWFAISYGYGGWWTYKIIRRWPNWFRAEGWGSIVPVFVMSPFVVPVVLVLDIFIRLRWLPEPDVSDTDRIEEEYKHDRL